MKHVASYNLIDFVRPGGFWPHPYTLEQAFGVFAHIASLAGEYPGDSATLALLSRKPTCTGFTQVDPLVSVADLRERLQYALLYPAGNVLLRWRKHFQPLIKPLAIRFPHHLYDKLPECEHDNRLGLDALLATVGKLTVQLNEFHRRAKNIYGIRLELCLDYRWRFVLRYGYDGSEWSHALAEQGKREAFLLTYFRARTALTELTKVRPK